MFCVQVEDFGRPKGRGVVTTRSFERNEFVVEYAGDLVNIEDANQREALYEKDLEAGCCMYYFTYRNKEYWWVITAI